MQMLALYSIKGGVGKTASAVNLAAEASLAGKRVLLWDLDPQAATTFYLKSKAKVRGGVDKLVKGKATLDKVIRATEIDRLDLLPASFGSREMDRLLEDRKPSRLRKILKPVSDDYDLVLLDCPPSLSALSGQVFPVSTPCWYRSFPPPCPCVPSPCCASIWMPRTIRVQCGRSPRWSIAASGCIATCWKRFPSSGRCGYPPRSRMPA
ncbi:ParA family protein [Modicisalibacter luteus]|uniref:ParA family protein n=1 Tax=Modicisalibacter luteus TaxID=453962 RepID=UPI00362F441A